ncbi:MULTISPECIES: SRPBCC family protein [Actinomadura]|uniref:SRPBCC family protein n=1 Tax=Actinomadura yumaensis TaxID=111807 RepID=A0ABW2D219_9ACTN|nr:SRPBCC family protein [Actinomadura sp. J1-007]MWK38937.1 SRPBCC family protein [Actinomadura sp. J1-007]
MVYNMHERFVAAEPRRIWELLTTIGGDHDRLWPEGGGHFRLPDGLRPGAPVEHSKLRYRVGAVEPEHRLWFDTGKQLSGGHGFTLHPQRGGTLVRHELKGRTGGMFRLMWPLVIRRQHDIVIEKILDNLVREAAGSTLEK